MPPNPSSTLSSFRRGPIGSRSELEAQLVAEYCVASLDRSLRFYESLGFCIERHAGGFAALRWDDAYLFLVETAVVEHQPPVNVRVIVSDVDATFERLRALGVVARGPVADTPYGLREFVVFDPDGFGIRFASVVAYADRAQR